MAKRLPFNDAQMFRVGEKLGINFKVFPFQLWKFGIEVELEHGTINKKTNVTNDDLMMTAKIALAHILEFPDYYQRLNRMENKAERYWSRHKKPNFMKS